MKKASVNKGHTASSKKKTKGDALKTFFSSTIIRTVRPLLPRTPYHTSSGEENGHRCAKKPVRAYRENGGRDPVLDRHPAEVIFLFRVKRPETAHPHLCLLSSPPQGLFKARRGKGFFSIFFLVTDPPRGRPCPGAGFIISEKWKGTVQ